MKKEKDHVNKETKTNTCSQGKVNTKEKLKGFDCSKEFGIDSINSYLSSII